MGIRSLYEKGRLKVWSDVLDEHFDDRAAPELGDAIEGGEKRYFYSNPDTFFARTYITRSMRNLISSIVSTLKNERGGKTFLLTSHYGGGKTHTMIAIYYAFTKPKSLEAVDRSLATEVATVKPLVVAIDCSRASLAPNPVSPYSTADGLKIRTLWGMLAYRLGAYDKVAELDHPDRPSPQVDILVDVLRRPDEPILILIDEITQYVFSMSKSKELEGYANNLMIFMDYLARAVENTPKIALIVSVHVEQRGGQIIGEVMYADLAEKLYKQLHRETAEIVTPVTPDDVVLILKRNVFEKIPEDEAKRAEDMLYSKYREYPEIFGSESSWRSTFEIPGKAFSVRNTYPFHPKYIDVLQEIVSRNRLLMKTRDAIRITRKVVRRILKGEKGDPTFVMPWHIDIGDQDIRNMILTENYREFRDVASKDIIDEDRRLGAISQCKRPRLAFMVALPILLKVYTYETLRIPQKTFPTLTDVALMVYDPETFSIEKLEPPDIKSTLDEMSTNLNYFNSSQDGRYWFDPYLPIIDLVKKRAKEILGSQRLDLYKIVKERVNGLLMKKTKRGERSKWEPPVFDIEKTQVIVYGDEIYGQLEIEDEPVYRLIVIVKPREYISDRDVEDIILKYKGSMRTYKNTIAVLLPKHGANFESILSYAAELKAAEEIHEELKEMLHEDEDLLKIRREKLRRYAQSVTDMLDSELLSTLTCIAYPKMNRNRQDIVDYGYKAEPSDTLIAQAVSILADPSVDKIRSRIRFNDLVEFLSRLLGWDLVDGEKPIEFDKILEVFFTNTAAPFTRREVIENAILSGLKDLKIGIKASGKIYWKKLGVNQPDMPESLGGNFEILPKKVVVKEFVKYLLLKEKESVEEGKLHKVWYEVEYGGDSYRLRDLVDKLNQQSWIEIIREGVIREKHDIIEQGCNLEVKPSIIDVDEGTPIEVMVSVAPIGGYSADVKLLPERGSVEPDSGKPPFIARWRIGPLAAGKYSIKISVVDANKPIRESALRVHVKGLEEEIVVKRLSEAHINGKLIEISVKDFAEIQKALRVVEQFNVKVDFSIKIDNSIIVNGTKVDTKLSNHVFQAFSLLAKTLQTEANATIIFEEPLVIHEDRVSVFSTLSEEKAIFKLKVRRGEHDKLRSYL